MGSRRYDVAVIGGGIIGMATAMELVNRHRLTLVLFEAERSLAAHQSGRNSGVVHAGLYYRPGSLKARYCVQGREEMYQFCREREIPYDRCGKVVVATRKNEIPSLHALEKRGKANGLSGLRYLQDGEIRDYEPHAGGIAGLFVPDTGIVDFAAVTEKFAEAVREGGGELRTGSRVTGIHGEEGGMVVESSGDTVRCRVVVNCGGLYSDRIARMCGVTPHLRIVPFRGEYYKLAANRRNLVKNLIYPVPDPAFPFLGVHFTRTVKGDVEAGPNAVLAFSRLGYNRFDISFFDMAETLSYGGFWKMVGRYWRAGIGEYTRSLFKNAFVGDLKRLVPEITGADIYPSGSGVRAQALEPDGSLVDDFRIVRSERTIHVLNAPSPAATASIPIGRTIAAMAAESLR